jgi:phosphate-selective porin OprO and OprP
MPARFLCALVLLTWLAGVAQADEQESYRALQARVEAMERQNQALIRALEARRIFDTPTRDDDVVSTAGEGAESDDEYIRGVVRDYLASEKTEKGGGSPEPDWYEVDSDTKMTASWKNGLEFESAHHDFRVHVGGRTQLDFGWFNANDGVQASLPANTRFRDGVDFRRARLRVDGTMYETMEWAAEFDFVNSAGVPTVIDITAPTDLWWQFNEIPLLQHFRVGNIKEPIGFEHLTSSRFLNFMERSFLQDAFFGGFNNGFTPGAMFFGTANEERMTWAMGVFNVTTNVFGFNTGSSEHAFTGRVTALPWYVDEGRGLIHVGVSARHWELDDDSARFRTRSSVRGGASANWPIVADTGIIIAENDQTVNAELVGVFGPLTIVSEYLTNWLQNAERPRGNNRGTLTYRGGYVEMLYFLTGENRAYNRKTGVFDRVVPAENAFYVKGEDGPVYGTGAWEVGGRYQYLDLNDNGINGGILHDTTVGLNWYMNPNFKVQANYFYMQREGVPEPGSGPVQGFGIRLSHDF